MKFKKDPGFEILDIDCKQLLTREEEVGLSKKILGKNTRKKDRATAFQKLVVRNVRLAVSIARSYKIRTLLPLDDLINEGYVGLCKAAQKFDHKKGCKFSTYATSWIRERISKFIRDNDRAVRLPSAFIDKVNQYPKYYDKLHKKLGRAPIDDEMMSSMKCNQDTFREIKAIRDGTRSFSSISVTSSMNENGISSITDEKDFNLLNNVDIKDSMEKVYKILQNENVPERSIEIVKMRFGIGKYEKPMKLEEIGNKYNISRERCRQIIEETLNVIKWRFYNVPKETKQNK